LYIGSPKSRLGGKPPSDVPANNMFRFANKFEFEVDVVESEVQMVKNAKCCVLSAISEK